MISCTALFDIVEERSCPYYNKGELLTIHDKAVLLPVGRPACLQLIRELTGLLVKLLPHIASDFVELRDTLYTCSGCSGLIKFKLAETPQKRAICVVDKGEVGISGLLDVVPPVELLQYLHMNKKTGRLLLDLEQETGGALFRNGGIIAAQYKKLDNREAVYALLEEKQGHFRFISGLPKTLMLAPEIGDFMSILLKGLKQFDEKKIWEREPQAM